jgi:hypothetical protein
MSDSDKIKELEERLKALESKMGKSPKSDKPKKPRKASKYNEFIKTELVKIKKEDKDIKHKDAFLAATKNWSAQKEKDANK